MTQRVVIGDLHTHTTHSDGILSPEELIDKAEKAGLSVLSITDHDTMQAHRYLAEQGYNGRLEILPGIEISCHDGGREVHMLAYGVDESNEAVREYERFFRADRSRRAHEMVDRLHTARAPISYEDVFETANGAPIGRPHVAAVLVRRGFARTIQQAFDLYLDHGRAAYVAKSPFPIATATEMVHKAGGVTSVAHPGRYFTEPRAFLHLVSSGIDGIEVYHPSHWFDTREYYRVLAEQHQLLITGGSDFHGSREYDDRNLGTFGITVTHYNALWERINNTRKRFN